MSKCLSFALYFISFMPLWISVIFIDIKSLFIDKTDSPWMERMSIAGLIIMILACMVFVLVKMAPSSHENANGYSIQEAKEQKTATIDFLLSYIMPLYAFDFTTWYGVVLFLFFFWIFWRLTAGHNIFSANIVMDLAKFRFYECKLMTGDNTIVEMTVLSKRELISRKGEEIYIKSLNNDIKLDVDR